MLEIPLLENKKMSGVCYVLTFGSHCWFLFVGRWFLGFQILMFSKNACYISPNFHVMLLRDIDLISMILMICFADLHHFSARVFSTFDISWVSNMFIFIKTICFFEKVPGFLGDLLGILVSPKTKIVGCGGSGHVPKSRNHGNEGF